jgi:hypothetical protein
MENTLTYEKILKNFVKKHNDSSNEENQINLKFSEHRCTVSLEFKKINYLIMDDGKCLEDAFEKVLFQCFRKFSLGKNELILNK